MKKTWNPRNVWVQFLHRQEGTRQSSRSQGSRPMQDESPDCASRHRAYDNPATLTKTGDVCVVLPVYNEQACIQKTFNAVFEYACRHPQFTFIFVNDGSSDRTKSIITASIHAAKTHQIQLVSYHPRAGKGYAIKRGVDHADAEFVCYLDSDLAYSLDHLERLVAALQQSDVAIGSRSLSPGNSSDLKFSRKIAGKVFNILSRKILNLGYRDMQAGLKGFRKNAAKALFAQQELTGFSFDVELIYLAKKWGYTIVEVPAKVSDQHQTKISTVNLLQDSIRMLIDLLKIRFNDLLGRY